MLCNGAISSDDGVYPNHRRSRCWARRDVSESCPTCKDASWRNLAPRQYRNRTQYRIAVGYAYGQPNLMFASNLNLTPVLAH